MCKQNKQNSQAFRAAIMVTPTDEPAKVAEIVAALANFKGFDFEVIGCAVPSASVLSVSSPMMGMPVLINDQGKERDRTEIQEVCHKIIRILDKDSSTDIKTEVGYIDGPLNQIAPSLVSAFDIAIIPHRLKLPMKFRILRPALDTLIMKSKKIPVLFCTDTSICWRIVAAQIDSSIGFQAEQILSRLAGSFRVPIYQWFPKESAGSVPPTETKEHRLSRLHVSRELDDDSVFTDQNGTLLAIPKAAILSLFRFHKFRRLLSNWEGNLLILP